MLQKHFTAEDGIERLDWNLFCGIYSAASGSVINYGSHEPQTGNSELASIFWNWPVVTSGFSAMPLKFATKMNPQQIINKLKAK